jgi:hypothetical protein
MIITIDKTKDGIKFKKDDGVEFTITQKELLCMSDIQRLPRKLKKYLKARPKPSL